MKQDPFNRDMDRQPTWKDIFGTQQTRSRELGLGQPRASARLGLVMIGCWLSSLASGAVVLPIEVFGPPPHTEGNTLEVAAGSDLTGAKLVVRAHNVSYDDKGRITVNGGTQYKLWNDVPEIEVAEPDRSYGGFGGGFGTVTFSMGGPDIDLQVGENTIEFQYFYKHPEHATAGYRIVGLDIVDAAGESLLAENQISFDDPTTWTAPLTDPADRAAGAAIWHSFNADQPNCTDCHADDGRDLKYFNISNKAIIEQCKKSGFTPLQGEQVASYIRSLGFEAPAQARPWNPPYQPGPGTDSRPVFEWAAGAGLDAVLKSDAEMLPHMFGSATQDEIDAVTDIRTDLNLREIPIALQFPDWIHWLPRVHPMELWGKEYWETERGERFPERNNPHESYLDLKQQFEDGLANGPGLINRVRSDFQRNVLWWIATGYTSHPWTTQDEKILEAAKARGYTAEKTKLELSRWRAVKLWALFNAYDAQDKAANLLPTAEKYQWPAEFYSVFQIAAHFIGDNRGTSRFAWESPEVGTYFSSIWYQLQMVLNPGMRQGGAVAPVDWAYNYAHVNLLGEVTGVHEPLRLVQNLIKGYQQRDRDAPAEVVSNTWTLREVSPWRHYSNYDGDQTTYQTLDTYGQGKELRLRILRSMLGQFVRRVNEYDESDWTRTNIREDGGDNWWQILGPDALPMREPDRVTNFKLFAQSGIRDAIDIDAMYRLIPRLHELGLEPSTVQGLVDWCAEMWPLADWQMRATDSDGDLLHDYWEGLHYGTLAWGANDDPNGTGVSNRDAYVFGGTSSRMDMTWRGDTLAFVYQRPKFMEGSGLVIDYSSDLVEWQLGTERAVTTNAIDELYESATELHLPTTDKAMFFRLRRIDTDVNTLSDTEDAEGPSTEGQLSY